MLSVTFYEIELPIKINKILLIATNMLSIPFNEIMLNNVYEIELQIC